MKYGIVIVSHSNEIASGVKKLIAEAAPDLSITTDEKVFIIFCVFDILLFRMFLPISETIKYIYIHL